ncbi:type II toxin-antitoxin system RelE/ParE family toxin [Microcoleus sp. A2-C5]|uniref:type II toxin-antitoxin system RelE family toxin n=1 Tax=Microcoleaceae TaxID=1892252 RepID=UPI002236F761|nr:type II toxin-antitoxin system RelE/ParE family toxin [Lyngbya sp. CCAP 1446/10]MCW6051735.1 type II toxin-antitoxin system RelE/ParE family toxin [Lyngbya sp. CCAP 1446/10]
MSYSVDLTAEAQVNQERLTPAVRERIGNKINWLAENFEQITPMPLSANLAGFFKLRVGDYRVIYTFNEELRVISVHQIGHRREIYD